MLAVFTTLALAAVETGSGDATPLGDLQTSYSSNAFAVLQQIRMRGLDAAIPPKSTPVQWAHTSQEAAHCQVQMQIYFYSVESLVAATGEMKLKVWMRLKWRDDRVAWEPAEFGHVTQVRMSAADGLWTPDIWLYNGQTSAA